MGTRSQKSEPLVSPFNWLALAAVAAFLLVTAIWAFTGSIPRMVDGRGVMLRNSEFGIFAVAGNVDGILADVFVSEGDVVAAGQPVAELRRETLRREIAGIEQALQSAEDRGNGTPKMVLETRLRKLRSRLETEQFIRSGQAGRVIEVALSPGSVVRPGEAVLRLESLSGDYEALIYVSALEGKKVRPGMEARIVPTVAHAEKSGYLRARVSYVSPHPVTRHYLVSELGGNKRLADWLLEQGSSTEVVLELIRDPDRPDAYEWSSGRPGASIESGMLLEGRIIFDHVRPISWLLSLDRE